MIEYICQTANGKSNKNGTLMDQENERSLNHGLGIGAVVGVAGWMAGTNCRIVRDAKAWRIIQGIHGT